MISPSRVLAFQILLEVERGGYAADLLHARAAALEARDAGLAQEIVLGVLRYQAQLDFLLDHFAGRPQKQLRMEVRIALRMGLYQLRYLDRVPPHAAVSETVEQVKQSRDRFAGGFANAVLRKVDRRKVNWPHRATELSHPEWMLASWERQFGAEPAVAIARANLSAPETFVRLPAGVAPPPDLSIEPTEVAGCFRLLAGTPTGIRIQDIGAQAVVPLLDLQPGHRFLDLCASPGNKTAQALEQAVRAVACEYHQSRLDPLRRLRCPVVRLDARAALPFRSDFDRVLVDAPCSGTGTLAHNPEIKWRLKKEHLAELHADQAAILSNALQLLRPGGRLVYSTCSLEREENEDVCNAVLSTSGSGRWRVERFWRRLPGRERGDGFFAAVITSE